MCFCYVMLRPLNHRQQMMDCTLTHVLAGGPRAVTVVGLCQGQSNVRKAFIFGT